MIAQGDIMPGPGATSGAAGSQSARAGKASGAESTPTSGAAPAKDESGGEERAAETGTGAFAALMAPQSDAAGAAAEMDTTTYRPPLRGDRAGSPATMSAETDAAPAVLKEQATDGLAATLAGTQPGVAETATAEAASSERHAEAAPTTTRTMSVRTLAEARAAAETPVSETAPALGPHAENGAPGSNAAASTGAAPATTAAPTRPAAVPVEGAAVAAPAAPRAELGPRGAAPEGGAADAAAPPAQDKAQPPAPAQHASFSQTTPVAYGDAAARGAMSGASDIPVLLDGDGAGGSGGAHAATSGRADTPLTVPSHSGPPPLSAPPGGERAAAQISAQIGLAARTGTGGGDRVEIRLDPPELGRVHLSFTVERDGIAALVSADRPEVVDLMRRHGDILQRDLTAAGYRNVTLDFARSETGGEDQRGARPDPDPTPSAPNDRNAEQLAIMAAWRGAPDDRLDIRF